MSTHNVKLFVATPMFGGQCHGTFTQSLLQLQMLCAIRNIEFQFRIITNESLIPRARNLLVREFLKSDFTHLMFIDSDIEFHAKDVLSLIEKDVPLIGGTYPGKKINWENIHNAAQYDHVHAKDLQHFSAIPLLRLNDEQIDLNQINMTEPYEVEGIPTGFMMVQRHVFEQLKPLVPSYEDPYKESDEVTHVFFDTSIKNGHFLSEDYHFCFLWREQGESVYWAPWIITNHIGTYTFQGGFNFAPKKEST